MNFFLLVSKLNFYVVVIVDIVVVVVVVALLVTITDKTATTGQNVAK